MKISIIGAGYVGLVSAVCFAHYGHKVVCHDTDVDKINMLSLARAPIYEPGLNDLLTNVVQSTQLQFSADIKSIFDAEMIIIAVGTPANEDGSANLSYLFQAATSIGQYLNRISTIVVKSTVPVGTTHKVAAIIKEQLQKREVKLVFDVASNPEFLRQGSAVYDFMHPDRIITGIETNNAAKHLRQMYAPLLARQDQLVEMDIVSAELTKYAANALLATKISFMNEISQIAERLGADIVNIKRGVGSDSRIGPSFLQAGCGFGGSCFPKDVASLNHIAHSLALTPQMLPAILNTNQSQKRIIFEKLLEFFDGQLAGKTIALWGLSFKPHTDDIREAPSLTLMELCWSANVMIQAHDPAAMGKIRQRYGNHVGLTLCQHAGETINGADVLVVLTEWPEFMNPDFQYLAQQLAHKSIFDGRNIYDPKEVQASGLNYYGIGRGFYWAKMTEAPLKQAVE